MRLTLEREEEIRSHWSGLQQPNDVISLLAEIDALRSDYNTLTQGETELGELRLERAFRAEKQRDQLREALEFYADRNNWRVINFDCETRGEITSSDIGCKSFNAENNFADFAIPSGGRRAREALDAIDACRAEGK